MKISNNRESFYQWELNQLVTDENFKLDDEVDFSTIKTRQALVVKVKEKNGVLVAEVPNILLQDYHPIFVHWIALDETGEYVQKEAEFEVKRRARPQDYVYSETEIWSYSELEQRIKTLESGGASPDAIDKAVKDYLEENPIEVELPEALPNPNKLVLTGAVSAEYDGTETVVIEIPQGGADIDLDDYATKKYVDEAIENIDISGGIVNETDPTVPGHVKNISEEDIAKWNLGGTGGVYVGEAEPPSEANVWLDPTEGVDKLIANVRLEGQNLIFVYSDNTTFSVTLPENGGGTGGGGDCLLKEVLVTVGEGGDVAVTGIELDYSTMSINVGESFQLAATVLPANATNNIVTWKSSDSSIATCVEGYITGLKDGTVTITASPIENSSIKATCVVTVKSTGGDTPGEPSEPAGTKIYFSELTPVKDETMINKNGTTEYSSTLNAYYQLPYSEGMAISTTVNKSHSTTYPPVVVNDGGNVTVHIGTETVINGSYCQYENTLTGYSSNAIVYVNSLKQYGDYNYYIGIAPSDPDEPDIPDEPDTPEEPDTPVTPDEPDEPEVPTGARIYFKDLTPVSENQGLLKSDGVTHYNSTGYQYYQIPYSEGMYVSTYYNRSFTNSYPPFIIKDGSTVKTTKGDETVISGSLCQYTTTLTGYSSSSVVYVNTRMDGSDDMKYYIEGGAN